MTSSTESSPIRKRASFAGWEQLLGLDGSAPATIDEAGGSAVLYLRVSTQRQMHTSADVEADGNSIATQRDLCVKRCARLKAPIAETFVEPGNSAQSIAKRPVFRELLSYIEQHPEVGYVVIYMRSRIFRNQADAAITKRILTAMGVKLISAKEEFGDGYMADAMEAITDIMNEVQVRQSGEDIRNKMLHKAKNGGTLGRAKIGYLNDRKDFDGRLVNTISVDAERAPLIRWAFEAYATGDYSVSRLRDELAEQGLRTRATAKWKSGPLSHNQLSLVLRDPYYMGMVTYKGELYEGRHDALVDAATFERVQQVLANRRKPSQLDRVHTPLLRGFLSCDRCHDAGRDFRVLYMESKGRNGEYFSYYFCRGRQEKECDLRHLPQREVELAVEREVRRHEIDGDFAEIMREHVLEAVDAQQSAHRTLRSRLLKQLSRLDTRESNLLDLAGDGEMATTAVQQRLREISIERKSINEKLLSTETEVREQAEYVLAYLKLLSHPYEFYVSADANLKRRVLETFFKQLWIDDDGQHVVIRSETHDAVSLIHAAMAEHREAQRKSASRVTDALGSSSREDATPTNYYLRVSGLSAVNLVGLVEAYSRKSEDAAHLRRLAASEPARQSVGAPKSLPRKARQLTDDEKMAFVEGYERGEPIAELATQFGVHRTTLDNLIRRLELTREDPDAVPQSAKDEIVASYRAGETLIAIGAGHGFSANKVQRLLVGMGEPVRARGPRGSSLSTAQIEEAVELYERGAAIGALAARYAVSYACVRKQLLAAGTYLRARGGARC